VKNTHIDEVAQAAAGAHGFFIVLVVDPRHTIPARRILHSKIIPVGCHHPSKALYLNFSPCFSGPKPPELTALDLQQINAGEGFDGGRRPRAGEGEGMGADGG